MKRGYIVHPDAANTLTQEFIRSIQMNPNSTFYKTWQDVTSKTRFELLVDQIFHYITTYGTDFSLGNGYVPNDNPEEVNYISYYRDYKVIMPCSKHDMYVKCMDMLASGIAMKQRTLEPICDYVAHYVSSYKMETPFNIDDVANREAVVMLCDKLDIAPNRKFDLLRYIIYKTTGKSTIIKNRDMINHIISNSNKFDFTKLSDTQLNGLASIFYRFKPLFLAFKKTRVVAWQKPVNNNNAPVINKIRRKAEKYHTPMVQTTEATIFNGNHAEDELLVAAANMTIYQVTRVCNACLERLNNNGELNMYIVRNGKVYYKASNKDISGMNLYYIRVFNVFYEELRCRLAENAQPVKYNTACKLAVPTSEKNFVGDFPFGTEFAIDTDAIIGIYWRNAWGTRDFDLSMIDVKGNKIGWNSYYYNTAQSVVYSGDMTNADPEATELLYYKNTAANGFIKINRYSGSDGSKYRLFFANEKFTQNEMYDSTRRRKKTYMVDPANIKLEAMCVSDSTEQTLGIVTGDKFITMNVGSGNGIVSNTRGKFTAQQTFDAIAHKAKNYLKLDQILKDSGYADYDVLVNEATDEYPAPDKYIDLTTISRDTLINIMECKA
jgi:hypothetical protein